MVYDGIISDLNLRNWHNRSFVACC